MNETNTSEVARLKECIACEYQAANRLFTDFTPTARHTYIAKRQETIAACFQELQQYVTAEEAATIVAQVSNEISNVSSPASKLHF